MGKVQACKFHQVKCCKCGKIGHIAPVCRSVRSTGKHKGQHRVRDTHCVDGQDTEGSDVEMYLHSKLDTRQAYQSGTAGGWATLDYGSGHGCSCFHALRVSLSEEVPQGEAGVHFHSAEDLHDLHR